MKINRKGFTLVELLVTIVIVGLVLALVVFGIFSAIDNSKDKAKNLSEKSIKEAARVYSGEAGSDSWKKSNEYDFDAFCVTIGELMNKGLLDKDSTINLDKVDKNTYVIVKRNRITLTVEKEEIAYENDINYGICTGTYVEPSETVTKPSIRSSVSYTDRLEVSFTNGEATTGVKNYKCLYGDSSSNINREGVIENNTCIATNLKNNHNYYIYIYMTTNAGTTVLAEGNNEYTTKDFSSTKFSQSGNVLNISYDSTNVYNDMASYYFNSDTSGKSNVSVQKCELNKNGLFSCAGSSSTEIKENVWYRTVNEDINITYPEETKVIKVTSRIYDGSNNYREDNKTFNIYKYTIKFYKNNAYSVGGSTASYVERSCIADSTNGCSINSPSIEVPTGYRVIGFNTNSTATSSSWDVNQSKNVNFNADYYAIAIENNVTYNIVYISTSGKELGRDTATYHYGTTNTIIPKEFSGYTSPSSQNVVWDSVNTKTITFVYTPILYNITYVLNDGTVSGNPSSYNIESNNITLNNPTKTGYTFSGWTGSNGTTPQTSVTITTGETGNKSYTANWKVNSYTYNIVYKSSTGIVLGSDTATYNYGTINTITPKAFSGYTSPSSQSVAWDSVNAKTITFVYTPIGYKITYDANGGTGAPEPQTKSYGVTLTLSSVIPTRTGYTFLGWSTDKNATTYTFKAGGDFTGNSNITLYAVWKINKYTVIYNANGGSGTTANSSHTYNVYKNLTKNGFTRSEVSNSITLNYRFLGWAKSSTGEVKYSDEQSVVNLTTGTNDVTLYAKWCKENYLVSYDLNGGTYNGSSTIDTLYLCSGDPYVLPAPIKKGYKFDIWRATYNGIGAGYGSDQENANTTIYTSPCNSGYAYCEAAYTATWDPITYTVKYDSNYGIGDISDSKHTYDVSKTLNSSDGFSNGSCLFDKWNTKRDGSGTSYKDKQSVKNLTSTDGKTITLYAQWKNC